MIRTHNAFVCLMLASLVLIASAIPVAVHQEEITFPVVVEPENTLTEQSAPTPEPIAEISPEPTSEITTEPSPEITAEPIPQVSAEPTTAPEVSGGSLPPSSDNYSPEESQAPPIVPAILPQEAHVGKGAFNEGCVAIEHLQGYVLQHPQHLNRRVLCANNFCATPNHAIIVDGAMTSMKRLCANKWQCVESMKLVNNLKISANRRAVINQRITVTPYDLRFPKAASWIAQIAEDLWNLIFNSIFAGAFIAIVAMSMSMEKSKKL